VEASALFLGVLGAFAVYSIAVALRPPSRKTFGLLALFIDTVFFLIVAGHDYEGALWLASIFYLFLLTEGISQNGPREVAIVACIAAAFGAVMPSTAAGLLERTVVVAGVLGIGFSVSRVRKAEEERRLIEEAEEARQATEKALESERQRIASDFHDGPLQSFISLQMRIEILRKLLERDFHAGMEDLHELQKLAQHQVSELRVFLRGMRPLEVDGANLFASARRTAERFQKESGIPVTFVGGNNPTSLAPEVAQEVLQMLREALHNVQKHAGATRVAVAMERTDRGLEISVDDNGHGFNFVGSYSLEELELLKLGPDSLKRRARSLNADFMLESRPGRGAGLKVRIPLP
jgi:signal transduction histidine kinase